MKRALLIAGGGTLGEYTSRELLMLGWKVDIIESTARVSLNKNQRWIHAQATDALLREIVTDTRYDTIVDFLHYTDPESYRARGMLLLEHTDQLIFLSSYRVYADTDKVITEKSPQWLDVCKDEYFLAHEDYAIPKSYNERWLRTCGRNNWTIIRPMISFSHYRLDLVTQGAQTFFLRAQQGKKTLLPAAARYLTAGVNWAGNVGKMIARLCGNIQTLSEAYTLGMGERHTWNDVAEVYTDVLGASFEWVDTDDYLHYATTESYGAYCMLHYDRLLDRQVDVSKVMQATNLKPEELISTRNGIIMELEYLAEHPMLVKRFSDTANMEVHQKMDRYLLQK